MIIYICEDVVQVKSRRVAIRLCTSCLPFVSLCERPGCITWIPKLVKPGSSFERPERLLVSCLADAHIGLLKPDNQKRVRF